MARRPPQRPGRPYLAGAPLLIAHRGGAGLAPENTLVAFAGALERWEADILELDVRATRDGRIVVLHDPTVDRTTDGKGLVRDLPWAAVRELDAGYRFRDRDGNHPFRGRGIRIPLLDQVLEAFPRTRLNVELKSGDAARATAKIVGRHGAEERVLIAATYEADRRPLRGYAGPWGASRRQIALFTLLHRAPGGAFHTPLADALQVPLTWRGIPIVTGRFVAEAHRRNIPVHVWTVDDPHQMRRLLALGVDGIQSDRPDLLARALVEDAGRPAPPGLRDGGRREP